MKDRLINETCLSLLAQTGNVIIDSNIPKLKIKHKNTTITKIIENKHIFI